MAGENAGAFWYLYILRCGDGTLYTGNTTDIQRRLAVHRRGTGAKYTRGRGPLELVYQEQLENHSLALQREAAVKAMPRREKLALIHGAAASGLEQP